MTRKLVRCLTLFDTVVYGVGLILGAGIYVLIGATAGIAGNMMWLSFVVAGIVAGFTASSYAELSSMYPRSAAEYVFVKEATNSPMLAWIIGFTAIIIGFVTSSAVAVGFARYLSLYVPLDLTLIAAALIIAMSLVSFWGIKESARFNIVATSVEVGGLLLIILVGGYQIFSGHIPVANLLELPPAATHGTALPVVSAAALIFFAYLGFEDIANIAEETVNPEKVLPKAYVLALVISTTIYILVAVVTVSVVPYTQLAAADQPLSDVTHVLIGGVAPDLIAMIALFATANTVLITLIVCARMLYGMAASYSLPAPLRKIHEQRHTPWIAVCITGAMSIVFLLFKQIEILASIADVGIFIMFFMVNMSNILLRYRLPDADRAWRAPMNIGRMPVLSALGAASCLGMLFTIHHSVEMFGRELSAFSIGLAIFALTIPLYFLIGRGHKALP